MTDFDLFMTFNRDLNYQEWVQYSWMDIEQLEELKYKKRNQDDSN